MNKSEQLLDKVIWSAYVNGSWKGCHLFPLNLQNAALRFFVIHVSYIPNISLAYLSHIANVLRDHPDDGETRLKAEFRPHRRRMVQRLVPIIVPIDRRAQWNKVIHGTFESHAHLIPDSSVDLVVTSPPYAMQRKTTYGGIEAQDYPAWTVRWMNEVRRVLKPTGSVVINIRPNVEDGQISDYMLRTRLDLRSAGWIECDEWIWIKPDAPPLGHNERPRRSWESVHWFARSKTPYCNPKATGSLTSKIGITSKKGLGQYLGKNSAGNSFGTSRSTDVLIAPVADNHRAEWNIHPAQYPVTLVEQIIQVLCPPNGLVLDPFMGSGTTAVAALKHGRRYLGFEKEAAYLTIINRRISEMREIS